jgi:hypothetical protein
VSVCLGVRGVAGTDARSHRRIDSFVCLRAKTGSIVQIISNIFTLLAISPTSHASEISPMNSLILDMSKTHSCDAVADALAALAAVRARGVSRLDGDPDGDERECDCDWRCACAVAPACKDACSSEDAADDGSMEEEAEGGIEPWAARSRKKAASADGRSVITPSAPHSSNAWKRIMGKANNAERRVVVGMRGKNEVDGGRRDRVAEEKHAFCLFRVASTQMNANRPANNIANPCSHLRKLLGLVEHPENDADAALLEVPIQPASRGQIALQSYRREIHG